MESQGGDQECFQGIGSKLTASEVGVVEERVRIIRT